MNRPGSAKTAADCRGEPPVGARSLRDRILDRVRNASLSNKIFFSTTAVILLISVLIALFTRWILISSLTSELKQRGLGIAYSIAEASRGYLLTADAPKLTSLLFESRLGERKHLVNYVFVEDKSGTILAHTFVRRFPQGLKGANPVAEEQVQNIRLLRMGGTAIYDIGVPVKEGIYQIGTVHVGLYKKHIDVLIGKLRTAFLGFVSAVTVVCFLISHRLSMYITRPISQLTTISDAVSRGHFDVQPDLGQVIRCWQTKGCGEADCPARRNASLPCWYVDDTPGLPESARRFPEKLATCRGCPVYRGRVQDEVRQLANSFVHMTYRIQVSQAQLRESEGKYRSLFASGPNPIFVLERDTLRILDANAAAEEAYRYRKQELVGRPFGILGPFEPPAGGWGRVESTPIRSPVVVSSKVQYRKKGGEPFYVNVHACPAVYGGKDALIVATTDITEMVEKDNQLIQASKLKTLGEMSAGIAHELNQPLNAIKMGSEYLEMMVEQGREIEPGNLMVVVQETSRQVDKATAIIRRLRDFGRKSDLSRDRLSINQPIRNVLEILGKQLELQNIEVEIALGEQIQPISAHRNRIEQVVFNLLTNARDALNQKAETGTGTDRRWIRIRTDQKDGQAVLEVSDNGTGIPEAVRSRIFESFFTTKEMGEGMGLGLSISYGIVEDYGGQIRVESREGKGTTFTLMFPTISGGRGGEPV